MSVIANWEICKKNLTNLTDEEFDKVFNIEGFCDPITNESDKNAPNQDTPTAILVYYPVLIITGMIANCLVTITILSRQRLHTVPNAFMVSLSIADFLMACVVVPLRIIEPLGSKETDYRISDMLFPLIGVASIFSLCSVTLDRYIHIRNALNYQKYMNKFRAFIVVTGIWLFAILQAFIVLFMVDQTKERIYNDIRFVLCFCVPALFIAAVYSKLFVIARSHARVIAAMTPSLAQNVPSSYKKDLKILKVVGLIVGAFFICWFPFFVLVSYELHTLEFDQQSSIFRVFMRTSECLACSTTVFNPILYGFLRRDLRQSIRNAVNCKNSRVDEETGG